MQKNPYICIKILLLFLIGPSLLRAQDLPVDLTALNAYVRLGFNKSWIQTLPEPGNPDWKIIKANKGNRPLRVQELGFEGLPRWKYFQKNTEIFTFTYLFHFTLGEQSIKEGHLALYLAQVGQNWEAYLNGTLLRSEYFPDSNQGLRKKRSLRKQLIKIPHHALQHGNNILAFRIVGDPSNNRHGFYMRHNYLIDRHEKLAPLQDETVELMFMAIYLFVGFYHLTLFLRRRKELYNLPMALTVFCLGVFYLARSNFINSFIHDTDYSKHIEIIVTFTGTAMLQSFMDLIMRKKLSLFTKIYLGISMIGAAISGVYERETLPLWQLSIPIFFLYILVYDLILPFLHQVRARLDLHRRNTGAPRIIYSSFYVLFSTISGNLLIGGVIVSASIFLDAFNMIRGIPITYTRYGFFIFVLGLVLMLANRFMGVHREMELLNLQLEEKVEERTKELSHANHGLNRTMGRMKQSLQVIRNLKVKQDADYFLTSLLIEPLGGNKSSNSLVKVEILQKQFKQFRFRKWSAEIGGDYSYAAEIKLKNRNYTLVLNSDSMGKSMQGAGGALVMGSVFRSLVTRTQQDPDAQDKFPEIWLKDCYHELQNVFVSFDGSMLVSMVVGLLSEEQGLFYHINAEHPLSILYRGNTARFIEKENPLRKVGVPYMDEELQVKTFQLLAGDVLILGSDGRDDIVLNTNSQGEREINEDQLAILKHVENGAGHLRATMDSLLNSGEFMDDFSLLRVSYREGLPHSPENENKSSEESKTSALRFTQEQDFQQAAHFWKKYLQLRPGDDEAIFSASNALRKNKQLKDAAELGERLRLRFPERLDILLYLSEIYQELGQSGHFQFCLEKALKLEPHNSRVLRLQKLL